MISVYYLLSIGWTLLSFALIFSGALPLTAAQQEYFASLGALDYLSSVGAGIVAITAAILLFRLRQSAVPAFGFAIALNIGLSLIQLLTRNWAAALGSSGLLGVLFGYGILVAVFLYARRLRHEGVLA